MKTAISAEMEYFTLREESFPVLLLRPAITGEQMKDILRAAWLLACEQEKNPLLEEGDEERCEITGMDWVAATYVAVIVIEPHVTQLQKQVIVHGFRWHLRKSRAEAYDILNMPSSIFMLMEHVVNVVKRPIPEPSLN